MTYQEMDRRLRALEPEEYEHKYYHTEPCYDDWETEEYRIGGETEQVYVMNWERSDTFFYKKSGGGITKKENKNKRIIDKQAPFVYMNKNARFAEVKPHIHDWIELGYMYSGSCVQTVRGKTVELKKGQIIILDSGIPHAIGRTGEDDIIVNLMFEKKYFTYSFFTRLSEESIVTEFLMNAISKQTSHDNYIFFDSQDDRRVQTFMKELICEFLSPTNMARDMINNLIALLFSSLVNSYEKKEAEGTAFPKSNYMVEILRYMEDNFRSCTLTDTAKKFNVNPGYLSEMLKKTMGYGFRELMMEHRLSYAASLLRGTYLPCEKIIADAGFGNNTYFYKKFREKYGCLPKDYRGREHNS